MLDKALIADERPFERRTGRHPSWVFLKPSGGQLVAAIVMLSAIGGSLAVTGHARADSAQVSRQSDAIAPDGTGWNAMLDRMRDLPSRILAKLPPALRDDPRVQQEAAELALGALTSAGIAGLGADVDHPMFLTLNGLLFGIGQPNADTVYRSANVSPNGTYRLRGKRGSLRMFIIAQHGPTPGDPVANVAAVSGPAKGSIDMNQVPVDAGGRFDLLVSAERPAGYTGAWWKLEPGTAKLLARLVSSDWGHEAEPTLSIERLDTPIRRSRPPAADLRQTLQRVADGANFIAPLLVTDPSMLRAEGVVNRLVPKTLDRGLLAGQYYYHGAYDLRDDEALLIEAKVPTTCRYWSIILTNHLYVTTDWSNNQSSLNDSQAKVDKDGVLRVVVASKDPGVPNWIDTAGYPQGLVQGRWFGCDAAPVPNARKLPLSQVRKALPADTPIIAPAQRESAIRERRAALQQRGIM